MSDDGVHVQRSLFLREEKGEHEFKAPRSTVAPAPCGFILLHRLKPLREIYDPASYSQTSRKHVPFLKVKYLCSYFPA